MVGALTAVALVAQVIHHLLLLPKAILVALDMSLELIEVAAGEAERVLLALMHHRAGRVTGALELQTQSAALALPILAVAAGAHGILVRALAALVVAAMVVVQGHRELQILAVAVVAVTTLALAMAAQAAPVS